MKEMETGRVVKEAPVKEQSTVHLVSVGPDRIKAFSDGVFAIALTLLILQVRFRHRPRLAVKRSFKISCSSSGQHISAMR
jgi:Endosomal/lysosomal potassium channel TMEM175